jgi:uncharacterized RDD family membrane protein YckC
VTAPEHLSIDTPEQISLEFPLAGVGSRFLALAFDTLLQALIGLVIVFAAGVMSAVLAGLGASRPWILAVLVLAMFVVYSGYFALFEAAWRGQTPGKRLVGLRVIDVSGSPVTVYGAILRNLIRIVDQLPGIYGVGIVSVLVTSRQQRLGDLAAGTVVVHERTEALAMPKTAAPPAASAGAHQLTADDLMVMEGFLRRRADLDPLLRLDTARRIAKRMADKLKIETADTDDEERLIERLVAEYRSSSRYRG